MSDQPIPHSVAAAEIATPHQRWLHAIPVVGLALILLYPIGLVLLVNRRTKRRWTKIVAAIVTLPLFALLALFALQRYWEFGGGMTFGSFRLDFSRGSAQDRRVEEHRAAQPTAPPMSPGLPVRAAPELQTLFWPAFRGPLRDGVVRDFTAITTDWTNDPPREVWRQPVGEGYASFVIGDGRIFTIEQRRNREAVTAYAITDGREIWMYDYPGAFREPLGGDGPRATPTLDGDRLFSQGAAGELTCLQAATGKRIWSRNILNEFDAQNLQWGLSASPLIVDDLVVVTNSGIGRGSIMAYQKSDGRPAWQTDAGQQAYSSPALATLLGRRFILNLAAFHLNGVDPQTGKVEWSFPWATSMGISCAQPLAIDDSRVFVSLGYGIGSALVKLESRADRIEAKQLWSNVKMKNKFASSVIHDGAIYGLDEDILACLDLDTGERKWKAGRYGYGSLLLVGKYLLVSTEYGKLVLVQATPDEHREVAKMQILEGKTWNNAVLAGGLLFARNHKDMVCYDLRPTTEPRPSGSGKP